MKSTLLVLLLLLPGFAFGQSLADAAKKEKERRERNKREGKEALVISEDELTAPTSGGSGIVQVEGSSTGGGTSTASRAPAPSSGSEDDGEFDEEDEYEDGDVPENIAPDLPLEQKLEMFERMKRARVDLG